MGGWGWGIIVKNNQSREENNLCWVWSKDKVPFTSENQVNSVILEPAVQSSVTSAAQLVTCSSIDGVRTWCRGAASSFPVTHPVTILHKHPVPSSLVSLSLDVQGSALPWSRKLNLLAIWQDAFVLWMLLGPSTDQGVFPGGLMLTDRYSPIASR